MVWPQEMMTEEEGGAQVPEGGDRVPRLRQGCSEVVEGGGDRGVVTLFTAEEPLAFESFSIASDRWEPLPFPSVDGSEAV